MIQFQGFKPSGIEKIANAMGFQGEEKDFQKFLEDNPDRQAEMLRYQDIARKMVEGGYVRKLSGGAYVDKDGKIKVRPDNRAKQTEESKPKKKSIRDISLDRVTDPKVPTGATVSPFAIPTGDAGQKVPTTSGMVDTTAPQATAKTAGTTTATRGGDPRAEMPDFRQPSTPHPIAKMPEDLRRELAKLMSDPAPRPMSEEDRRKFEEIARTHSDYRLQSDQPATMQADTVTDKVTAVTEATEAARLDPNDPRSKVTAAEATKSAVSDLDAAQGTATKLENPVQREIQDGELIEPVANAEKAAKFTEQIEAATATQTDTDTHAHTHVLTHNVMHPHAPDKCFLCCNCGLGAMQNPQLATSNRNQRK